MQSFARTATSLIATAAALVVSLASATSASAQTPDKKADKAGAAAAPKTKVYDFSGDKIEGDLIKPEGSSVDARDFAKHSSLIRIRKDFIPEIVKSAEDL
jgi:hypothetical protein